MENRSLFDDDAHYTQQAIELNDVTVTFARMLFDSLMSKGYSLREISHLMMTAIWDVEIETMLAPVTNKVPSYTRDTKDSPTTGGVIFYTRADCSLTLEEVTHDITVVCGKWYTFSAWAKSNCQNTKILLSDATTKVIGIPYASSWTRYICTFKATSTTLIIKLVTGVTGVIGDQRGCFDDVVVIELDSVKEVSINE